MSGVNQLKFLKNRFWWIIPVVLSGILAYWIVGRDVGVQEDSEDHSDEGIERIVADWPLFRGGAEMQGASVESLAPPLALAWSYEPEQEDGKRRPPIEASPVIAGGTVFVGTQAGTFLALDLDSGDLVWSFEAEGPIMAPAAAHEGRIYFGDTYGFVYALTANSGEEIWRYETEGKIEGGVNLLEDVQGTTGVYVGSHDYYLYCLDAENGEVIWKHETGNYVVATPSIVTSGENREVCFGGCDGLLHVLGADGKGEKREIEIGSYIANTSAVRDGIIYVAHNGGEILAIDLGSGEEVWRIQTGTQYTASPAVDEKNVYVAGPDKRLVAYDRVLGEEQWSFLARRSLDSSPILSGDVIWQAGMDGRIYAVNKEDGTELWQYEVGAQFKASPALSRGTLVVCGADGVVYAFQ